MAFMGCVSSRPREAQLLAIEDAVKENAHGRLKSLLADSTLVSEDLNRKNLLHQAAWLGHPKCVKLLLDHGADPDWAHRKNGCTPLHLAHFCTVEDTNPSPTIESLVGAGACVNNTGSHKCGKYPIDHAIQHQRLDSVQALLSKQSKVTLQSVLIAIDVLSPQIIEMLLFSQGDCGRMLESHLFWGQPLHRVLYTPLKSPKECYKQMFKLMVQATVCMPLLHVTADQEPSRKPSNQHLMVETELKSLSRDYTELTMYLYAFMVRNGFYPTESIKSFIAEIGELEWVDEYMESPMSLRETCMRTLRSYTYLSGNILYGVSKLSLPGRIKDMIILANPF